jgi:hypothetical protein
LRLLGLAEVPVRILDIEAIVLGEADENAQRLGFAPSEAVEIYDAVIETEKDLARRRQLAGLRKGKEPAEREVEPGAGKSRNGEARDLAAAKTGWSEKSLRQAHACGRPVSLW